MMCLEDIFVMRDLEKRIADGYVSRRKHPRLPLYILNYTQKCVHDNLWDAVTTQCRGLIYHNPRMDGTLYPYENVIVAFPPIKFWNYNDPAHPETLPANFAPLGKPIIHEKMDGSPGIIWTYDGEYGVATRGSFDSPQAVWATKWLQERITWLRTNRFTDFALPGGYTVFAEIIYKGDQKVVPYDFEGLVVLGAVAISSLRPEYKRPLLLRWCKTNGLMCVRQVRKTIEECVKEDIAGQEGYVVTFIHNSGRGTRVKIKFPEYCRLHKILTNFNMRDVWEMMEDGKDFAALMGEDTPIHFRRWLTGVRTSIREQYDAIDAEVAKLFLELKLDPAVDRKLNAEKVLQHKKYSDILFAMLDNKNYGQHIWKRVKPRGDAKFILEEEETNGIIG
jgi:RNA ligase